jgi:phenylacetate-coenzyme A ligase PaaK-like adenylate-forming protein
MIDFPNAEMLCKTVDPLTWNAEKSELFVAACKEFAHFHREKCADIEKLYARHGFSPESIVDESSLERIPFVGVQAMKYFLLTSLPAGDAKLKLTSSGTRGQKTQIWFDEPSLNRVGKMLEMLWIQQGLVSQTPANYLMMIYDPKQAGDLGIAFSIANQQKFAPISDCHFAISKNSSDCWHMDKKVIIAKLEEFQESGRPLRIHGIPIFIFELIEHLESIGRSFSFGKESLVVTGGGWKTAEGKKVTAEEFRQRLSDRFHILPERIVDGYGMAEHSAPYNTCTRHRFHVPAFCRVIVRDPVTLRAQSPGRAGLLELMTPFNAMVPNLAILSTDVGQIDQDPCPCGLNSPTFTLIGRGGLTKHKGCAITASEIVKRGS